MKIKNTLLFMLYALCLGAIIGLIIWSFMNLVSLGTEFLWKTIPNIVQIPFYTIIVCTIGGLFIGLWKKKTGDYPEEMQEVIAKAKNDGRYPYNKTGVICVSTLLPLIFGASVGPESGLIGIIVGLCSWLNDKLKRFFKEIKELTQIGISATLGTIFNSPMFGFALPLETEDNEISIPKTSKIILYFTSIFGALGIVMILKNIFGGNTGLANFEGLEYGITEWLYLLPLSLIGLIFGILYSLFNKLTNKISKKIDNYTIIKCTLAGIILGIAGSILPFVMFSGEEQMGEIISHYGEMGILILLSTGIVKLLITNLCNSFGLKGGHFFPCIFSGICIGYAFALITGINPVFSVCAITTSLMAYLIKKPFAVVLLLMICFPVQAIPVMLIASVIGSFKGDDNVEFQKK